MIHSTLRGGARRMLPVFVLAMTLCVVLLSGCGPASSSGGVPAAAAVNGHTVSLAQYQDMVRIFELVNNTPQDWQSPGGRTGLAGAQRNALDFLINLEVMRQQVAAQHLHPSAKARADARKSIQDSLSANLKQSPNDSRTIALIHAANADVLDLYAEQAADTQALAGSAAIKVSSAHLRALAATSQADAQKYQQQVQQGADFATVAKAHSQDPSLPAGGDIGTIYQGQLPANFDTAIFPTTTSATPAVSYAIVHDTQFYYVFQISERKQSALSSITDQQQQTSLLNAWLAQQRGHSSVERFVAIG